MWRTRACCAALGGVEDGGAVSQGPGAFQWLEHPVECGPLVLSPAQETSLASPAARTADAASATKGRRGQQPWST